MANLTLTLSLRKRWWFWGAVIIGYCLVRIGVVRDKASAAHVNGVEPAMDRVINWIADKGLVAVVA